MGLEHEAVALLLDFILLEPDGLQLLAGAHIKAVVHMFGRHPVPFGVAEGRVLHLAQNQPLVDQLHEGLGRGDQPQIVEHLVPEAGIEQVQHGVLGPAHVEIDGHPVALLLRIDEALVVVRVDVAQVVPAGARPLGHRVRFAVEVFDLDVGRRLHAGLEQPDGPLGRHPAPDAHPVDGPRQRRLRLGVGIGGRLRPEILQVGQLDRQLRLVQRIGAAGAPARFVHLVHDGKRLAPVALAAEEPVAQPVLNGALAQSLALEPFDNHALGLLVVQAVERDLVVGRVDVGPIALVGPFLQVAALHNLDDRQVVLAGELPVALVVAGHGHDGARAVMAKHVVGNPDGNLLAGGRVDGIAAGEDAGLFAGQLGALQVRLLLSLAAVGFHLGPVLRRGDLVHQRMLGCQHHVGGAEERVGPGRKHADAGIQPHHGELDLGPFRPPDPVALHFLNALGPVEQLQVFKQPVGVGRDAQHPLAHGPAIDGIAAALRPAVDHLLVGQHGPECRTPVDGHFGLIGQPHLVELQKDPLGPLVIARIGRVDLAVPVVRKAQAFELSPEAGDIAFGGDARMRVCLDRVLLGRQPEGVPSHRMEHVIAFHAPVASHDVGGRIAFGMPYVQPGPAGIGKHVEHVVLGLVRIEARLTGTGRPEGFMLVPVTLPLFFDFSERIPGHGLARSRVLVKSRGNIRRESGDCLSEKRQKAPARGLLPTGRQAFNRSPEGHAQRE